MMQAFSRYQQQTWTNPHPPPPRALSGRPPFTARTQEEAESFFLASLSSWKEGVGLGGRKVVLVGHSLGGYLAAAYALRYPHHVQHLVLVCPAGVPKVGCVCVYGAHKQYARQQYACSSRATGGGGLTPPRQALGPLVVVVAMQSTACQHHLHCLRCHLHRHLHPHPHQPLHPVLRPPAHTRT